MRLLRDEYRWPQHVGLPDTDRQPEEGDESDHAPAAYAGLEGSHPRPDRIVRAIRADRALAAVRPAAAGPRAPAIPRGSRQARRFVGVHSLLLLLDRVPELLVESGPLSRPFDPAAVVPVACRQPRSAHRRAPRSARRPVPALSLPHHHELHRDLPEGAEPGARNLPYEANDGRARMTPHPPPPLAGEGKGGSRKVA